MSSNRREFIKQGSIAGAGLAGLTMVSNDLFAQKKEKGKSSAER